ncbi:PREDICTED: LOW QUALITY PROTEIN: LIRP [Trachymyrmex cornetzi]|nr:PREDICTED: LOW QUALITY PROTEIN: LIRP [Trachymyrmex cornetzi]
MRDTTLAIVVAIIVVIKSHLLCPRQRSTSSSEKECQTVILPRVIEKSSCDPAFTSTYSMSANRLNVLVTLLLAVALLVMESGNAQVDGYPQFSSKRSAVNAPQKYCGKKLSNALQIICDGVYNSMFKKSGQAREEANVDSRDSNFDYVRTQEMEMADYPIAYEFPPFLPRARARGMLDGRFAGRRYRRQGRGIHEECCINPCTINELTSYCGGRGSASE